MKTILGLLVLASLNVSAIEVSPSEMRQLLQTADHMQIQLDSLRSNITNMMNRGNGPAKVYEGSCGTDRYATIGGTDCADLEAVLRRPRLSLELRQDIEGAISCAREKAIQNCYADNGGYCDLLPGYSTDKIAPSWSGDVNYKCKIIAKARSR